MKQLIACCGLNCELCDARIATINNDNELRIKTAELWAKLNNAPILPEHINCDGCRLDGEKTFFCSSLCEIRKCCISKKINTCIECSAMDICKQVQAIFENNSEAKNNLKNLL